MCIISNRSSSCSKNSLQMFVLYTSGQIYQNRSINKEIHTIIKIYHKSVEEVDKSVPGLTVWHDDALPSDVNNDLRDRFYICS